LTFGLPDLLIFLRRCFFPAFRTFLAPLVFLVSFPSLFGDMILNPFFAFASTRSIIVREEPANHARLEPTSFCVERFERSEAVERLERLERL
jgi:hypothetical protein